MRWLLVLWLAMPAFSTTYYMRADGVAASKASATSCSAAATAMNVATHNSQTFSPGDIITLCDTGGDFIDAILTPPSSGSNGNQITYNNSGSPVINGATVLNSGWTLQSSGKMTADSNTVALYNFNGNLNDSSSHARTLTAGNTAAYTTGYYDQALAGSKYVSYSDSQSGDANAFDFGNATSFTVEAWVNLTSGTTAFGEVFCKGVAGVTRYELNITRNGASTSFQAFAYNGTQNPVVTYSPGNANLFDNGWHHIAMRVDWANTIDHSLSLWIDGVSRGTPVVLSGVSFDNTYNFTVGARSDGSSVSPWAVDEVRVSNIARTSFPTAPGYMPNTWSTVLTTQPNIVLVNRAAGVQEASATALSAPGQWFWSANTLYLNSASNPASAYTSPGVEVPSRSFGIDTNGKSYLTIQGLTVLGANYHGIVFSAADSNVLIQNNTLTLNGDAGIEAQNLAAATNVTVQNNTISWNGGNGLLGMKSVHDWTVQNNTVFHNCQNSGNSVNLGSQNAFDWQFCGGIRFWEFWTDSTSTIYNTVVQNNTVSYNGQYGDGTWAVVGAVVQGVGIWFDVIDSALGGNVIRYNNSFGNLFAEIYLEHNQHVSAYGNLAHDSAPAFTVGIFVTDSVHSAGRFSANNSVYNNTVYNNSSYGIRNEGAQTPTAGTCLNNAFTNNISYGNVLPQLTGQYGGENDGTNGSGNTYTYNSFGAEATNFIMWGDGVNKSTYTAWETASGNCGLSGCTHSMQSDPALTNPASSDFSLTRTSPARNVGTPISGFPFPYGTPDLGALPYYAKSANSLAF